MTKKNLSLIIAIGLFLSLALAGTAHAAPITDLLSYQVSSAEMETFNILYTQKSQDLNVLGNCIDGLLTNDPYGKLVPCLAEKWETEDNGLNWTFHIRKGVQWVDVNGNEKAETTAHDFLYGLEWVLNFHKNDAANISMPRAMIKGAGEYYEYTKEQAADSDIATKSDLTKFKEMVGIEAVDDYTLVYHCSAPFSYFDTLATYNCLYPVSGKLLEELGVSGYKAVNNTTLWYNGPYTMTTFIHQNEKVLTRNPKYWDQNAKLFNSINIRMVESLDTCLHLFKTGELHHIDLTESHLQNIYRNKDSELHPLLTEKRPSKFSVLIKFVFNKKNEDGTLDENWNKAVANKAFRLAWYYGLDLTPYLRRQNAINPLKCANYTYSAANLCVTSDGKDYVQLVQDRLGVTPDGKTLVRLDKEKAAAYKKQAMEELTQQGVTFPIEVSTHIKSGNQSAIDTAMVLKQIYSDCLGDDFIRLNIKEYVSSLTQEVTKPQLNSYFITGWGADYGDPLNFLEQELYGDDNAYFSQSYSKINLATDEELINTYKTFTDMVRKADAVKDDKDLRYSLFADAEAYFIENALNIPLYIDIGWHLTCINDYSKIYVPYGIQMVRYVNWETDDQGYTTADYEKFAAEYEANRK